MLLVTSYTGSWCFVFYWNNYLTMKLAVQSSINALVSNVKLEGCKPKKPAPIGNWLLPIKSP